MAPMTGKKGGSKRARHEDYEELQGNVGLDSRLEGGASEEDEEGASSPEDIYGSEGDGDGDGDENEEDDEEEEDDFGSEKLSDGGEDVHQQISNVSFGALQKAQDAMSRKRKRGSGTNDDQQEKLETLRKRLREIKAQKAGTAPQSASTASQARPERNSQARVQVAEDNEEQGEDDEDASDSDSAPSEEGPPSRISKHAPTAQSTRHQVTRKRQVIEIPKQHFRDPRFDALSHRQPQHPGITSKAYDFLTDYQKDEITQLRTALKATKSEDEKILLRRKINSMENRLKSKEAKEREQEVLRRHRKEERAKVEETGKNPYYLKRKDLKQQALVEKYNSLKGKERQKLVEKRKKKESQKERRMMPTDRRMAG